MIGINSNDYRSNSLNRDICAFDAAGYAEVLIPFLANLLGSVELYASSICTIIETMNLTVEAHVVEPRAGMFSFTLFISRGYIHFFPFVSKYLSNYFIIA